MLYRKKPVVVEAVKWDGENDEEVKAFCGSSGNPVIRQARGKLVHCFDIYTLEGWVYASPGDYIIRGVHGEFYPCKPDIFEETYESVEGDADEKYCETCGRWTEHKDSRYGDCALEKGHLFHRREFCDKWERKDGTT